MEGGVKTDDDCNNNYLSNAILYPGLGSKHLIVFVSWGAVWSAGS